MRVFSAMRGSRRLAALVLGTLIVLAGCTGVPSDSEPMVIKTVPIAGAGDRPAATSPPAGIAPRTLVSDFLQANVLDASEQTSPRGFLSSAARASWTDSVVTVVDSPTVRLYDPASQSVLVTGNVLGTIDATGIYTPSLQGTGGQPQSFVYGVHLIDGQYRITSLHNGLLLSQSDFLSYFTQRSVYYFDLAHHYLVPDPRWTSLTDPTSLADFLMTDMAGSPSVAIQNIVSTDTLPTQNSARRINVEVGPVTRIEIPGASQLTPEGRNRLAEQVAATLGDVVRSNQLVITDGGQPVRIPQAHSQRFTADQVTGVTAPPTPPPDVLFLRRGQVFGQDDTLLKGAVNSGAYFLQSVAAAQDRALATLDIAATAGSKNAAQLLVGTQSGGLRQTTVHGSLTRPAFAPGRAEVWVGDGTKIYLVAVDNVAKTQTVSSVGLPANAAGGVIIALRFSPDGSRIGLVIRTGSGDQQLYVGAVVRGPGQVRIDTLQQVTPAGVVVTDLAWAEPLKLLAIGYNPSTTDRHIYAVGSDGSGFSSQGIGNLPSGPTTLTVAVHQPAWVTANNAVWEQGAANTWYAPGPDVQTDGYAAVYLE